VTRAILRPRAVKDIGLLRGWLLERSPRAAERASEAIGAAIALLQEFPESGRSLGDGTREAVAPFGRDGFILRYRATPEVVVILRVHHGRQRR